CAQHGLMLGRPRDQRPAGREPASSTEHGEIHGFRAAGAEDDVARRDTERDRGEAAGRVESGAGGATLSVQAGRVSGGARGRWGGGGAAGRRGGGGGGARYRRGEELVAISGGLLEEVGEPALEVLQREVHVEHFVGLDRLGHGRRWLADNRLTQDVRVVRQT